MRLHRVVHLLVDIVRMGERVLQSAYDAAAVVMIVAAATVVMILLMTMRVCGVCSVLVHSPSTLVG